MAKIPKGQYYWISEEDLGTNPDEITTTISEAGFQMVFYYVPGSGYYFPESQVDEAEEDDWLASFPSYGFGPVLESIQAFYFG